jgi:PPM family protein phosphatase
MTRNFQSEHSQQSEQSKPSRGQIPGPLSFAYSDTGMIRESNQDAYLLEPGLGLFIVADGMGGRAGGEVASRLAVDSLSIEVAKHLNQVKDLELNGRRSFFTSTINRASLRIYERSLELPQYRGMGTTVSLLWISPFASELDSFSNFAIIGHVGDSRCYLNRSGILFQLTDDHSLVNEQIKAGILSPRDPMISQMRNVITRCVGYQEEEEVDTRALQILPGDRFLLCSDGLSTKVSDEEIRKALDQKDLENVPRELTDLANERGGDDNITVVIVAV